MAFLTSALMSEFGFIMSQVALNVHIYLFTFPHNEGKVCFICWNRPVLLAYPLIAFCVTLRGGLKWIINYIIVVSKGPFPKEICFAVCLGQRER